jgi:broad specificity phosphatase PhoE
MESGRQFGVNRNEDGETQAESMEFLKTKTRVFFIRHSKATYASYSEKLASDSPESELDLDAQVPDLPKAGKELARNSAQEFFSKLDPEDSILYVVSSTQMRALETADIYTHVAREMGFELVTHDKAPSLTGNEQVRTLENLSLKFENQVLASVFQSSSRLPEINWNAVDAETKEKFDQARKIVLADDKGAWGENFHAHAEAVREIIPEMETPEGLYDTQYKNMLKLADFAREKAVSEKQVIVIAFGHENYMGHALEIDTGEAGIANTEAVEFMEEGKLRRVE